MNELNLQNPDFLKNIISIDLNYHRILIHFLHGNEDFYLFSRKNVMDNYQVWHPLGLKMNLISFNDLKFLCKDIYFLGDE
jgi:hypothetical protein